MDLIPYCLSSPSREVDTIKRLVHAHPYIFYPFINTHIYGHIYYSLHKLSDTTCAVLWLTFSLSMYFGQLPTWEVLNFLNFYPSYNLDWTYLFKRLKQSGSLCLFMSKSVQFPCFFGALYFFPCGLHAYILCQTSYRMICLLLIDL